MINHNKIKIIAEIGCNHKGDIDTAKKLIEIAAQSGADIAKFQKRNNLELLGEEGYNKSHPVPENSYGETYGLHRDFLEFSLDVHSELIEHCENNNIEYSTSVWDISSAKDMAALKPRMLKIPSATNQHFDLQGYLCDHYAGEIHVSTGMTTRNEIERIVSFYEERNRAKDLVLYACTSGYPVPFEDLCLMEISRLQKQYGNRVKSIGFSGHHLGIAADVAAMAIGVRGANDGLGEFEYIERHFTLDRTWKGTDHAASLEPQGLARLCRDIENCHKALTYKENDVLEIEKVQRDKLKWAPIEN